MMASRRPGRDRIGGAGTLDTSWESAAWDARCSTFFRDRWVRGLRRSLTTILIRRPFVQPRAGVLKVW